MLRAPPNFGWKYTTTKNIGLHSDVINLGTTSGGGTYGSGMRGGGGAN